MVVISFCFWPWCSIAVVNIKTLKMLSYISRWLLVAGLTRTLVSPRWGRMTTWTALMRVAGEGGRRCFFFKPDIWPTLSFLKVSNPSKKEEEGAASKPASMFQMMNHIQSLISMAVENAKQEEKSISHQKSEFMFILATKSSKDRHLELLVYPFNRTVHCRVVYMYNVQCTMYNVQCTYNPAASYKSLWTMNTG